MKTLQILLILLVCILFNGCHTTNTDKTKYVDHKAIDVVLDQYLDMPEDAVLTLFGKPYYTNMCAVSQLTGRLDNYIRDKYSPNKLNTIIKTISYDNIDKICKIVFWLENRCGRWRVIADARILKESELKEWQTLRILKPGLGAKKATDVAIDQYLDLTDRRILIFFGEPFYTNICAINQLTNKLDNRIRNKYTPNKLNTKILTLKYNNIDKIYGMVFWFEYQSGRWRVIADAKYLMEAELNGFQNYHEVNKDPDINKKIAGVLFDKYLDMTESAILTIFGEPYSTNIDTVSKFALGLSNHVRQKYLPNQMNTRIKTISYYKIDKMFEMIFWLENKNGTWRVISDAKYLIGTIF